MARKSAPDKSDLRFDNNPVQKDDSAEEMRHMLGDDCFFENENTPINVRTNDGKIVSINVVATSKDSARPQKIHAIQGLAEVHAAESL